jgi:hypothetical protein
LTQDIRLLGRAICGLAWRLRTDSADLAPVRLSNTTAHAGERAYVP